MANWKTNINTNNRETLYSAIRYATRKINEKSKKIKALGNNESDYVNDMMLTTNAVKDSKGKIIDKRGDFIEADEYGNVKFKSPKEALNKLTTKQLKKYVKALYELHNKKAFSIRGIKKVFADKSDKAWSTITENHKADYTEEQWKQIEKNKQQFIDQLFASAKANSGLSSDQVFEDFVKGKILINETSIKEMLDNRANKRNDFKRWEKYMVKNRGKNVR